MRPNSSTPSRREGDTLQRHIRIAMRMKLTVLVVAMFVAVAAFLAGSRAFTRAASAAESPFPDAAVDDALAAKNGRETIVVAGGCFRGVQAVFHHTKGVLNAASGYAGGGVKNPAYEHVSSGTTGHAESVQVVYDPAQISL